MLIENSVNGIINLKLEFKKCKTENAKNVVEKNKRYKVLTQNLKI